MDRLDKSVHQTMIPYTWPAATSRNLAVFILAITICELCSAHAQAQMGMSGGGGGGGGGSGAPPGMPMFDDPKFRDRVFEAGGPQVDERTGKLILSVVVKGNRSVSENKVLSLIQSRPDRLYDRDTFHRDISELYRSGLFEKIEPSFTETEEGVHIKLVLQEKLTVTSVTFHGAQALDDKQLKKHCGLDVGDPCGPPSVKAAESRILEFYQEKGFAHADVKAVSGLRPGERDLVFRISEGPVERIWDIAFVGNKAFDSSLLKARIKSRDARSGVTSYMFNIAKSETMDEDLERLLNYYRSLGYFDARVDNRIDYDDSGKWVYLSFIISEGERYQVRNVEIAGNEYYTADELRTLLKCKTNEPFNQSKKSYDERVLRDAYGEKGFIFADVTARLKYLPNNEVDLLYSIAEGDVYRASDVRVHIEGGDAYTKQTVVLTKIGDIRPGKMLSSVAMENGERRLAATTIFNTNPADGGPPRIEVQQDEAALFDNP